MRTPRLYTPQAIQLNQVISLEAQAAHHAATVLRIKKGRPIVLFNGQDYHGVKGEFIGEVCEIKRKSVEIICREFIEKNTQSSIDFHLGICLIKNDRMDWLIQKATELGATQLTPLLSQNTDRKLSKQPSEKKQAHWQQVMINACEQSGRTDLMSINPPIVLNSYLDASQAELKIILHPHSNHVANLTDKPESIDCVIGPEGGFTEEEVKQANTQGFKTMQLGSRILRAETAPLVVLSILQYHFDAF